MAISAALLIQAGRPASYSPGPYHNSPTTKFQQNGTMCVSVLDEDSTYFLGPFFRRRFCGSLIFPGRSGPNCINGQHS